VERPIRSEAPLDEVQQADARRLLAQARGRSAGSAADREAPPRRARRSSGHARSGVTARTAVAAIATGATGPTRRLAAEPASDKDAGAEILILGR